MDVEATLPLTAGETSSTQATQGSAKRRRYYSQSRRRSGYRGKRYRRNMPRINKFHTGLPPSILMKHSYVDNYKLDNTGTTTVAATQQFRLNSLYDPDYTGSGHQPYYYDQIAALYAEYCVYGVKVDIYAGSESVTSPILLSIAPSLSTSLPTDAELGLERPQASRLFVDAGGASQRFVKYYKIYEILGVPKSECFIDDALSASGTNPSRPLYLNLSAICGDTSVACILNINVKMTFYCKWSKRIDQTAS